jgi:hypothetical protein
MAGVDRTTVEEVVRKVLLDDHADVIRESVAGNGAVRRCTRRTDVCRPFAVSTPRGLGG